MIQTAHVSAGAPTINVGALVGELRAMAARLLPRMYRKEEGVFAFRLRRGQGRDRLEGISRRYTAIVLLALADEPEGLAREALHGEAPAAACNRLIDAVSGSRDVGEVALTLWAARSLDHPRVPQVLAQLESMNPAEGRWPTVETAWCLSAAVAHGSSTTSLPLAEAVTNLLLSRFKPATGLFAHGPCRGAARLMSQHVCCFADLVYPTQALSMYGWATGDRAVLEAAESCARAMCRTQGPAGQWWWHYDIRTGQVVERYPVYAVHQDGMGPMALFAVLEAGGTDHRESIVRSLGWMNQPPEIRGSLMDRESDVVWRKVARREPGKLVRNLQAAASRVHPAWRVPGSDRLFPPVSIDFESRPYHMGWILYAFSRSRSALITGSES